MLAKRNIGENIGEEAPANPPAGKQEAVKDPSPRKIIYTATVELVVTDLTAAEGQLRKLVKEHEGFISRSDVAGRMGTRRDGTWTLRIPVARFDDFMAEVTNLGVPQNSKTDSQDVTEEFYDLQARIKNKKVEEERLLKHLDKSTGKLEDILAVEREISRVRGEIEQMEGKLKVLGNRSELTTVTVHCQEIKDYVPPQAPGFGSTIADTFSGSLGALTSLGKGLILVAVALTPWLPLIALLSVGSWGLARWVHRSTVPAVSTAEQAPPGS
jgi:hypothetical protein